MAEYIERELTDTEEAVFKATVAFIVENEYPPSVRELCEITGLKSTNTIHAKLQALERKGYISTQRGAPRTIRILKDRPDVVEVVRCKGCKHLTVYNSPTLYAYCEKTHFRFEPFQTDTRTHFCGFGAKMDGKGEK